jgi:hypothetical protein
MSVLMVTAKVKEESVDELETAAKRMFAAIDEQQPSNIRYASGRLADGVTFVALLEVSEGTDNPLRGLPEFREFQEGLRDWVVEPPSAGPVTVVGSYRIFD